MKACILCSCLQSIIVILLDMQKCSESTNDMNVMYRDGDRLLVERRRCCGDVEHDLDLRWDISSFIFFAFCFALKNSNSPSFSQPSLYNTHTHNTHPDFLCPLFLKLHINCYNIREITFYSHCRSLMVAKSLLTCFSWITISTNVIRQIFGNVCCLNDCQ